MSGISVLPARHDDDIYIYIYIIVYLCVCVCVCASPVTPLYKQNKMDLMYEFIYECVQRNVKYRRKYILLYVREKVLRQKGL